MRPGPPSGISAPPPPAGQGSGLTGGPGVTPVNGNLGGTASGSPGVTPVNINFGAPAPLSQAPSVSGVAPALLLDIETPAGDTYFWSDRPLKQILSVMTPSLSSSGSAGSSGSSGSSSGSGFTIIGQGGVYGSPGVAPGPVITGQGPQPVDYLPWLLGVGTLNFNRSLNTDTGSLTVQNVSGDVLQSDFERIVRRATLEGSLYVLRYYDVAMEWAWVEQHGTLTVGDTSRGSATLQLQQLFQGQDDTPEQEASETCQLVWGQKRCGATGNTECLYTYASCQVPYHFVGIQTAFEVNNPSTVSALPAQTFNRKRSW